MQVQSTLLKQIMAVQQQRKMAIRYRDVLLAMRYHHEEKILQKQLHKLYPATGANLSLQKQIFS